MCVGGGVCGRMRNQGNARRREEVNCTSIFGTLVLSPVLLSHS